MVKPYMIGMIMQTLIYKRVYDKVPTKDQAEDQLI